MTDDGEGAEDGAGGRDVWRFVEPGERAASDPSGVPAERDEPDGFYGAGSATGAGTPVQWGDVTVLHESTWNWPTGVVAPVGLPAVRPIDWRQRYAWSMRTRDRAARQRKTDSERLALQGLPAWRDEHELAEGLGLTRRELQWFCVHRPGGVGSHYVAFTVPKRAGGERVIYAPKRRLKAVQRLLHERLVGRLRVHDAAHGFVPGRSVLTNALPHAGRAVVMRFDLRDCFGSIHFGRVRGLMLAVGYGYPVATLLALLMTGEPGRAMDADARVGLAESRSAPGQRVCVQGAPTSPGLCNAVLWRMDWRLQGLAARYGMRYTRYADDLTLSGDDGGVVPGVMRVVGRIVRGEGFTLRRDKTRVLRRGTRQAVTGVTVNEEAGLSRTERRLRAAVHQATRAGAAWTEAEHRRLRGRLAYLKMLNAGQAAPLVEAYGVGLSMDGRQG